MNANLTTQLTNQQNIANLKVSVEQLYRMVGELQQRLQRADDQIKVLTGWTGRTSSGT